MSSWWCVNVDALEEQLWPGNIRELSNVIERTVLLTDQATVSRKEIEKWLPETKAGAPIVRRRANHPSSPGSSGVPLVREYRPHSSHNAEDLRNAMRLHGGNQSRAAQSLGLTPRQFGYRWHRLSALENS